MTTVSIAKVLQLQTTLTCGRCGSAKDYHDVATPGDTREESQASERIRDSVRRDGWGTIERRGPKADPFDRRSLCFDCMLAFDEWLKGKAIRCKA